MHGIWTFAIDVQGCLIASDVVRGPRNFDPGQSWNGSKIALYMKTAQGKLMFTLCIQEMIKKTTKGRIGSCHRGNWTIISRLANTLQST